METLQSPIGRMSWVYVFGDGDPEEKKTSKYKVTLMLPKNAKAFKTLGINPAQKKKVLAEVKTFIAQLRKEAEACAKGKFGKKWKSPGVRFDPVLDGDEKADSWEGNKNFWLIRLKTKYKPKVGGPKAGTYIVDGNDDEQDGFYAGCWGRVALSVYPYQVEGNRGVACGLSYVQKAWNDEPFTQGGFEFDEDVEDLDVDESDVDEFEEEEEEEEDEWGDDED